MPRANHFGPSILVLLTIGAVLFAAPVAIGIGGTFVAVAATSSEYGIFFLAVEKGSW